MTLPPDVILRPLRPADLDQIMPLEHVLFGPGAWTHGMFREEIDAWGRWYVVAESLAPPDENTETTIDPPARAILGYAGLWFDGDIAQVMTIGVDPRAQRSGIGGALLAALIEQSGALGAQAVFLEVRIDNSAAIRLYERFGFHHLGIRKRYYQPEDVDALTMRLNLTDDVG